MFFFCSFCQHIRRLDTSHSGIVMVTYISCNGRWFRVSTQPGKSGKKGFFLIKTWKKPGIIFGKSYKIMWCIFFRFQIQKLIVNTIFLWIIFISKCKLSKLKPFWNESGELCLKNIFVFLVENMKVKSKSEFKDKRLNDAR